MIRYLTGDATNPIGNMSRVIVHVCNDSGGWGKGFVLALSSKWSAPESDYRKWSKGGAKGGFRLGAVQFVEVENLLWVADLIGQHGTRSIDDVPPIRYEAIREGLRAVRQFCDSKRATVHMPRIGCGLAGGEWSVVEAIIQEELSHKGIPVCVYDFPERKFPLDEDPD